MTIVQCQLNLCLFCCIILCTFRAQTQKLLPIIIGLLSAEAIYKIVYVSRRIN